jgi:hypothetical protein
LIKRYNKINELDLFLASQGIKKKSVEDELKFAEDVSTKKLAILKKEFDAGNISKQHMNLKS